MKTFILAGSVTGLICLAQTPCMAEVQLVSESIELVSLRKACKLVRESEPKYDVTYKVNGGSVTRSIYSDLCTRVTVQPTSRIFTYLDSDSSPIIGVVGANEDQPDLSFPVFSSFLLKGQK